MAAFAVIYDPSVRGYRDKDGKFLGYKKDGRFCSECGRLVMYMQYAQETDDGVICWWCSDEYKRLWEIK